jgi:hypothetical protein
MDPSNTAPWVPGDDAELTAGWRLWLELSTRTWPDAAWDGTPADAVRQLRELVSVCEDIETEYLGQHAMLSGTILRLLRYMVLTASFPIELWRDDTSALDAERAALLHSDLAGFSDHAACVRAVLARGGGWTELDAERSTWGYPAD